MFDDDMMRSRILNHFDMSTLALSFIVFIIDILQLQLYSFTYKFIFSDYFPGFSTEIDD